MRVKMRSKKLNRLHTFYIIVLLVLLFLPVQRQVFAQGQDSGKKPLTPADIMKFKRIDSWGISEKGEWAVYHTQPGRGNSEAVVINIDSGKSYTIPRGANPIISGDGRWVSAILQPDTLEVENSPKEKTPKPGLAILDTASGNTISLEKVKGFMFSGDSHWLVYRLYPEDAPEAPEAPKTPEEKAGEKPGEKKSQQVTSPLVLRELASGEEIRIDHVGDSALDPASRYLAYSLFNTAQDEAINGIYLRDLKKGGTDDLKLHGNPGAKYSNLSWSKTKSRLAFIFHRNTKANPQNNPGDNTKPNGTAAPEKPGNDKAGEIETYESEIIVWDGLANKLHTAVSKKRAPAGWMIPGKNILTWSTDEGRLFFGFKPVDEYLWVSSRPPRPKETAADLYNPDAILKKSQVDVWHWDDPLIISQQKMQWETVKDRTYPSVYHLEDDWFVHLCDKQVPELAIPDSPAFALSFSDLPYQKESSWDELYRDVYLMDLMNGSREKILTRQRNSVSLSPRGGYVVYFKDNQWYLYTVRSRTTRNLTAALNIPFYHEDHDYPSVPPDYGVAGWTEEDQSVLIYDRYDIWQFFTASPDVLCITGGEGRKNKISFRIKKLDPEERFFKKNQALLLEAVFQEEKVESVYGGSVGQKGIKPLIRGPYRFSILGKAKEAGRILYTRENFEEFPDLWVSDLEFKTPRKISGVNPQIKNFLWGKGELIEWRSLDGVRLQGAVFKPENFDKNKRYPVLVHLYRKYSDRLYRFSPVEIDQGPCLPYYTGNGYIVFLPDLQFEIGRPGLSAVKCLVPGVQKLIEAGAADPKAIGIHGHSWGGYETVFIITQTNLFAAAVAGAPVSNMTSAYNGIRKGSGKARQFQYEKSQSRIGAGLIEAPELYLQNSPIFYADRIQTPLLIQFGDQDDAVPWQQGIELYLTMRRLNKNCLLLQYNDELHRLKKYANKLDAAIKMKEFLDHYLKGAPAPGWISKGIPYKKE